MIGWDGCEETSCCRMKERTEEKRSVCSRGLTKERLPSDMRTTESALLFTYVRNWTSRLQKAERRKPQKNVYTGKVVEEVVAILHWLLVSAIARAMTIAKVHDRTNKVQLFHAFLPQGCDCDVHVMFPDNICQILCTPSSEGVPGFAATTNDKRSVRSHISHEFQGARFLVQLVNDLRVEVGIVSEQFFDMLMDLLRDVWRHAVVADEPLALQTWCSR